MADRLKNVVERCAKDIIRKRCTAQDLALVYGVTDRTVYRYIHDKLPKLNPKLHAEVLEVMKEIRSESMTEKYKLRDLRKNKNQDIEISA